jgi:hypothetical protein
MKLQYIVTPIAGSSIVGRWIYTIEKGTDGKRRINLLPETAKEFIDKGWLILDDVAPPVTITDAEKAPEYDFKGSTVRNARPPVNRYSSNRTLVNPAVGSDKGSILIFSNEVMVRVVSNADGASAVWSIDGATA